MNFTHCSDGSIANCEQVNTSLIVSLLLTLNKYFPTRVLTTIHQQKKHHKMMYNVGSHFYLPRLAFDKEESVFSSNYKVQF